MAEHHEKEGFRKRKPRSAIRVAETVQVRIRKTAKLHRVGISTV
jgi:hypothetical protein